MGAKQKRHPHFTSTRERREEEMRKKLKEARQKAGMTQQQMADKLGISLRYYQNIETGDRTGDFVLWDTLEDITGIHQRMLRAISTSHPDTKDSQAKHLKRRR